MQTEQNQINGWKRIAMNLTKDEAKAYIKIVKTQQIYNNRNDAKYVKAELESGSWSVYCTNKFSDLSDDEIISFKNLGHDFL